MRRQRRYVLTDIKRRICELDAASIAYYRRNPCVACEDLLGINLVPLDGDVQCKNPLKSGNTLREGNPESKDESPMLATTTAYVARHGRTRRSL